MKKVIKWVVIGVLAAVVLTAVVLTAGIGYAVWQYCYDGLRIGMTLEEYGEVEEAWGQFNYNNYSFREKKNGDGLVVHFAFNAETREYTVDEMRFYSTFSLGDPDENFDKIKPGMGLFEVVSLMGIPHSSATSGVKSICYEGDSGTTYVIFLWQDIENRNTEYIVNKTMKSE